MQWVSKNLMKLAKVKTSSSAGGKAGAVAPSGKNAMTMKKKSPGMAPIKKGGAKKNSAPAKKAGAKTSAAPQKGKSSHKAAAAKDGKHRSAKPPEKRSEQAKPQEKNHGVAGAAKPHAPASKKAVGAVSSSAPHAAAVPANTVASSKKAANAPVQNGDAKIENKAINSNNLKKVSDTVTSQNEGVADELKVKPRKKAEAGEEVPNEAAASASSEEIVLTDAEGRRYCRVKDCDQLALVDTYCRYHYLLYWKNIQVRKKILTEGKLERYIEELTARYPDKYLEMLRKDLRSEKDFLSAIQELEIDDTSGDNEYEDEAQSYLEEVRGMGGEVATREEEDF
jgi:hypothetical protein